MSMRIAVHDSIAFSFDLQQFVDYFVANGFESTIVESGASVAEYDCVVTFSHDDTFFEAPWVHCIRAGIDEFPTDRYAETDTKLTNSPGIHATTIGETVAGMMLMFARRLHRYRDNQHDNEWRVEPYDAAFTLNGETICVIGLGTLGEGVALRADALGMDVVGVRRRPKPVPGVREVFRPDDLHDAIADARFVVLCVPLSNNTEKMIGADEFAVMRDDSYLINVARGAIVDENALIDSLDTGEIAGAGLDAHVEEPLPADSPLWEFENSVVTPHTGALANTYHEDVGDLVLANLERIERGKEMFDRII
jgi:D-2-hydroxyacid dehydrogenase (NADP+)